MRGPLGGCIGTDTKRSHPTEAELWQLRYHRALVARAIAAARSVEDDTDEAYFTAGEGSDTEFSDCLEP